MADIEKFMADVSGRLNAVEASIGAKALKEATTSSPPQELRPSGSGFHVNDEVVSKLDYFIKTKFDRFQPTSKNIDEKLYAMVCAMKECFVKMRDVVAFAANNQRPSEEEIQNLFQPIAEQLKNVQKIRLDPEYASHEKAILEGLLSVLWVNPSVGSPVAYVESLRDASVYYANKIRIVYKQKENGKYHVTWCDELNDIFQGLCDFIAQNQKTGLEWKDRNCGQRGYTSGKTSTAHQSAQEAPAMTNVFAELSKIDQTSGKTAGLRHVSDEMKSKNQKDRSSTVPISAAAPLAPASTVKTTSAEKDPRVELVGQKWTIENVSNNQVKSLEEDQLDIKKSVYIFNCNNATIVLNGKCNSIAVDNCNGLKLIFDSVVAACELVNCRKVKVQCNKIVPTVSIDKCDGVTVYIMNRDVAKAVKFVTSKSSEMNVSWPSAKDDEGFLEKPIPEQFVSAIRDDESISTAVSGLYHD